jgi:sec-independent protein translocase protein TatC
MTTSNRKAEDALKEQPFVSHLMELRDRLMRVVVGVLVIFVGLFPFSNDIYQYVSRPLLEKLPQGQEMIATGVISPFLAPFKLTLVAAIFIAMPYILYQFWGFVAPGLYRHERRVMLPMVGSSALLFYLGAAFAYTVVFPLVFAFMVATTPEGVNMAPDITQYLEFVLTLFFAFGLAFEVPIATIILVWMGLTTPDKLAQKRPYIIVGAFCIGMLLTPPDVISQTLLALPMWVLFEVGVLFSRVIVRQKVEREAAEKEAAQEDIELPEQAASNPGAAAAATAPSVPEDVIPGFDGDPSPAAAGNAIDEERYTPLTEEELEAELEAAEVEASQVPEDGAEDTVTAKLREVNRMRDEGDTAAARQLLYEVLAEGDEEQIFVARNILEQLDGD